MSKKKRSLYLYLVSKVLDKVNKTRDGFQLIGFFSATLILKRNATTLINSKSHGPRLF
jgi:hypothetical protein